MGVTIKLATCCYCGTKTRLALTAGEPRALLCENCGAPLNRLKFIKKEIEPEPRPVKKIGPQRRRSSKRASGYRSEAERGGRRRQAPPRKKKRRARRRSFWRTVSRQLEDWLDEIEDLFD